MSRSRNKGNKRCIACLGRDTTRRLRDRTARYADGYGLPRRSGKQTTDDPYLGECAKNICGRH